MRNLRGYTLVVLTVGFICPSILSQPVWGQQLPRQEDGPHGWANIRENHPVTPGQSLNGQPFLTAPEWQWNTFMGSSSPDRGRGIAVDGSGYVYIVGYSEGSWGVPINAHAGWVDVFVAKLNGDGVREWTTFLGGSTYDDYGKAIALDQDGNVYVAGESDATWGSPLNEYAGGSWDVFVAKLNNNGVLIWNTFIGSSATDYGEGIVVDGNGNVCVTGWSNASWGSPRNPHSGDRDGFVAKLDSSGLLQWNTFVGSSLADESNDIAVDGSGNIYVAGMSRATWGTPQRPHSGGRDGFAAKLDMGGVVQWNTFMGSSRTDYCEGIAVGDNNSVYVAGWSGGAWGSPNNNYTGGDDGFVAKLNSSGGMLWNTFMGSSSADGANSIAVDASGNAYVAGESKVTWGTPVNPFTGDGFEDGFAAKLTSGGLLLWNTFMGASSWDYGMSITLDNSEYVHIAGTTYLNTWGSPVNPHAGWGYDAFAVKFDYSGVVDVESDVALPKEFGVLQNYPNPFNPSTEIEFALPHAGEIALKVYNTLGEEVATLVEGNHAAGIFKATWDASGMPSGVYFYRLTAGEYVQTKKMVLMK